MLIKVRPGRSAVITNLNRRVSPAGGVGACEPEQLVQGCRLEEGACVCGLGCDTTFRYATREQCQAALKVSGQVRDEREGERERG